MLSGFISKAKANTYVVSSNLNGGSGSLRTAITNANNSPGRDTIVFNLGATVAARTITLTSALPNINDTLLIDGSSTDVNPFGNSNAKIIIRSNGNSMNGLRLQADACEIYGLVLTGFQNGIYFSVTDTLKNIRIGALGKGNVISGNSNGGITGFDGKNIIIQSNFIGLDTSGTVSSPNGGAGIGFSSTLSSSLIGGYIPDEGNAVATNGILGIYQAGGDSLRVIGNRIGTSYDGNQLLGNGGTGIYIGSIGENRDLIIENNIICGCDNGGIRIDSYRGIIRNNKVGTDATGYLDFGNSGSYGIMIDGDVNQVHNNIISGNTGDGIAINQFSDSCVISGNRIGTSADGLLPIGNDGFGVAVQGNHCIIGGESDSLRNTIGANLTGIEVSSPNCSIINNRIGIGSDGIAPLGNNAFGIFTANADSFNIYKNIISCNFARGIQLNSGSGVIAGNIIGARADSSLSDVQQIRGIEVWSPVRVNIGGVPLNGNYIAGNSDAGIFLNASRNCSIEGNKIGSESTGNGGNGITLFGGCKSIQIGAWGRENRFQQNDGHGIGVSAASDSVCMQHNFFRCNGQFTNEGGIGMEAGANSGIIAPSANLTGNVIQGAAPAGQRIDIFSAETECIACEGWMPLGHTVSNVDNAWFFNLNQSYDRIVAIASDTLANRSSDFSDCLQLPLLTHSNQPAGAVYPNPTSDYVIINGTVTDERITVYDLNGRNVLSVTAKGTTTKITLDKLVNGIYLIHHNGSNYKLLVDKN
jgi:parallel beta-helix repeat protein